MLSSSFAALAAEPPPSDVPYQGGVFNRKPVAATSAAVPDTVPTSKVWAALLQVDKQGRTNQVVVRLDTRSAALKTALSRSASPSQLDTQPGFEAAFVKALEAQTDAALISQFGGAQGARHLLIDARMADRERIGADAADPREVMQQFIVLRYPDVASALNAEALLRESAVVVTVQNDVALSLSTGTPTDTLYPIPPGVTNAANYQWGMHAMKFASAWARTTGHSYVGIADAPIWNYNVNNLYDFDSIQNPDLQYNFRRQFASLSWSVVNPLGSSIHDWNWSSNNIGAHGQHVTGIVSSAASISLRNSGGQTNLGTAGGCPDCSVILSGRRGGTTGSSELAESIYALVDRGTQVINISANANASALSCLAGDTTRVAIEFAQTRDVLVVISSGNQGSSVGARYPANCPNVLVVGAAQTATPASPETGWTRWQFDPNVAVDNSSDGSNFTHANDVRGVIAPGRRIVSTFGTANTNYIDGAYGCGSGSGFDQGQLGDIFGTCTGTSMSAPHVTALVGILRSAKPLATQTSVQQVVRDAGRFPNGTTISTNDEFGHGMPKADLAIEAIIPVGNPQSRLTPLFSMYSAGRQDYIYSTFPQMGRAALAGTLEPRGNNASNGYLSVGTTVNGYLNFPASLWYQYTGAQTWIFTTPENPKNAGLPLAPLYRLSFACNHPQYSNASSPTACANNPEHTDTTYTTDIAGLNAFLTVGYRLDGVEGYIYPKTQSQPLGSVRLMRKYNPARDDHAIFPETELTNMVNEGYTQNSGSDWLGYVYPNSTGDVPVIQ